MNKKDRFTKKEIAEYATGALLTLFAIYAFLIALYNFTTIWIALGLFVSVVGVSIFFIHHMKLTQMKQRLITVTATSSILSLFFFLVVLNIAITDIKFMMLYPLAVATSLLGAMILDVLIGN